MKITTGTKVKLVYTLKISNGKIIETIPDDKPIEIPFGANQLLHEFEEKLSGLKKDDQFDITIKADNAYGKTDAYAIFDIPLETFEVDGKVDEKMIQMGNVIPMTDKDKNKHMGKIIKILKDAVTLDFNHPLAGKDLNFVGKIISVESDKK